MLLLRLPSTRPFVRACATTAVPPAARTLREALDQAVVGHAHVKEAILLALVAREHVYIEGPPGVAKTRLAEVAADVCGLSRFAVQLHRDTRVAELVGDSVVVREKAEEGQRSSEKIRLSVDRGGILTCHVAVLDDISRAPGEALNVLFRVLAERRFGDGGGRLPLLSAIATGNPPPGAADHEPEEDPEAGRTEGGAAALAEGEEAEEAEEGDFLRARGLHSALEALDAAILDRFTLQVRAVGFVEAGDWERCAEVFDLAAQEPSPRGLPETAPVLRPAPGPAAGGDTAASGEGLGTAPAADLAALHAAYDGLDPIDAEVRQVVVEVLRILRQEHRLRQGRNALLSDRSFLAKSPRLLKAAAVLRGDRRVIPEDAHALGFLTTFRVPPRVHRRMPAIVAEAIARVRDRDSGPGAPGGAEGTGGANGGSAATGAERAAAGQREGGAASAGAGPQADRESRRPSDAMPDPGPAPSPPPPQQDNPAANAEEDRHTEAQGEPETAPPVDTADRKAHADGSSSSGACPPDLDDHATDREAMQSGRATHVLRSPRESVFWTAVLGPLAALLQTIGGTDGARAVPPPRPAAPAKERPGEGLSAKNSAGLRMFARALRGNMDRQREERARRALATAGPRKVEDPGGAPVAARATSSLAGLRDVACAVELGDWCSRPSPRLPPLLQRVRKLPPEPPEVGGHLAIVRDISASMADYWCCKPLAFAEVPKVSPHFWAAGIAARVVGLCRERRMRVGYVEFSSEAHARRQGPRFWREDFDAVIAEAHRAMCHGATNYEAALDVALAELSTAAHGPRAERRRGHVGGELHLVFLTDGLPSEGDVELRAQRDKAVGLGCTVHTIFVGEGHYPEVLHDLAGATGGVRFQAVPDKEARMVRVFDRTTDARDRDVLLSDGTVAQILGPRKAEEALGWSERIAKVVGGGWR